MRSSIVFCVLVSSLVWTCSAQLRQPPDDERCGELEGECNACICCCYRPGLALMKYKPDENCGCKADFAPGFGMAMVLLGTTSVITFISACYFSGRLPISPFRVGLVELRSIEMSRMSDNRG